jgi:L-lysine exporter family protein LysE/ArgO
LIALITGFFTGLSLIVAIGAQNAFVIKQGLKREHVIMVVALCAISDAVLIFLGTGGLGALLQRQRDLLEVLRWFGVSYLIWFGIKSFRSALNNKSMVASAENPASVIKVALTCLGFTYLNPHVYLDTVIFLGSLANQFQSDRWIFAAGGSIASVLWFTTIGFGAQAAAKYMAKPIFWKVLDFVIAGIMFTVALALAFFKF